MIEIARHLKEVVNNALPHLRSINDQTAALRPAPDKWSKKEIMGHLIDSAGNNQQKFVRLLEQNPLDFPGYNQGTWVMLQRYNLADWHQLISLWQLCNQHLAHIIAHSVPDKLQHQLTIDGKGPFTLEFIMKDYVEHLKHHLSQIIPESGITSKFENIYTS